MNGSLRRILNFSDGFFMCEHINERIKHPIFIFNKNGSQVDFKRSMYLYATKLFNMTNKELVKKAITEAFVNRDPSAVDKYWSDNYIQHNP